MPTRSARCSSRQALPACVPWLLPLILAGALLQGCASPSVDTPTQPGASGQAPLAWHERLDQWQDAQAVLLGEKHDAPEHQRWEQDTVAWLAARQRLAAVVVEMADSGGATAGLPATASAAQVRAALRWDDQLWPWDRYAGVVMAAVAAGVPVYGGNLPRAQMRQAMQDSRYDQHLPAPAWQRQRQAIAQGHCGLLPEDKLTPMARIQLARDESMARTLQAHLQPGRSVLLVAGHGHVQRSLGVPTWLAAQTVQRQAIAQAGEPQPGIAQEADHIERTPAQAPHDPCAALRARWPGAAGAASQPRR